MQEQLGGLEKRVLKLHAQLEVSLLFVDQW